MWPSAAGSARDPFRIKDTQCVSVLQKLILPVLKEHYKLRKGGWNGHPAKVMIALLLAAI